MITAYKLANRKEDAARIFKQIRAGGIKKRPSKSFIKSLSLRMRNSGGYSPNTNSIAHTTTTRSSRDKQKEQHLMEHAERLAIAYGILKTPPKTPLLIGNNLRVCLDCHAFIKGISKLTERTITLRDPNRIHVFTPDGKCSCNDYF